MAKNKISEWSSTAANNTDIGGIDIAEGCAPSGINNAIRELMAQVKDQQTGTDADNFTVGGNLSVTGTTTATGAITANGGVVGNVTGNLTGNVTGNATTATTAANLSSTLAIANGGTGQTTAENAFTALKQAATDTATGVVELATNAEVVTGTDTTRAVTPASMKAGLNATGSAPIYACRAWVRFNGIGTVSIQGSGNVTSVSDDGTGLYTINFTTAMPDENYCVVANCNTTATSHGTNVNIGATYSTTQVSVRVLETTLVDRSIITVAIFR